MRKSGCNDSNKDIEIIKVIQTLLIQFVESKKLVILGLTKILIAYYKSLSYV